MKEKFRPSPLEKSSPALSQGVGEAGILWAFLDPLR